MTQGPKVLTIDERFESKVDRSGDCHIWTGSLDTHGYGMFRVGRNRVRRAHRVGWELANHPVPDGTVFLHSCDNPPCVNPAHVRPGSHAENAHDRDAKGRHRVHRKVPAEALDQIRAWVSYGFTRHTVAQWFGLSDRYVYGLSEGYPRGRRKV